MLLVQYWCFIGSVRDFLRPSGHKARINSLFLSALVKHYITLQSITASKYWQTPALIYRTFPAGNQAVRSWCDMWDMHHLYHCSMFKCSDFRVCLWWYLFQLNLRLGSSLCWDSFIFHSQPAASQYSSSTIKFGAEWWQPVRDSHYYWQLQWDSNQHQTIFPGYVLLYVPFTF